MSLAPGVRLGPYEVIEAAGAGGMGEVYRARDTQLDRDVALKVLPDAFAADAERLARFEREARILGSLGHPNIAAILGFEERGPARALVLEFVEGPTLDERIRRGALPPDEALAVARQIADALEAAHDLGIVHRDLKPGNIKVRPDGMVKVLDFGLAKAVEPAGWASEAGDAPTITSPAVTAMGVLLGTAAYMSPEQARGRPIDKRTDNWAFGCVLYEMLTGKRAFPGDTATDALAAVIAHEPDWQALPGGLSPTIRRLLGRCLEKDPKRRLRDIGEARIALEDASNGKEPPGTEHLPAGRRRTLIMVALGSAVLTTLVALVVTWQLWRPDPPMLTRLSIVPPEDAPLILQWVAITPDGRRVLYVSGAGTQISVRALDEVVPRHLTNLGMPAYPFVSPDGRLVGFFDGLNALKVVPITGGPAVTVCSLRGTAGRGGAWTTDGHIVFATDDPATGLWRVPERGGTPQLLTKPTDGRGDQVWPHLLPDGRTALVTVLGGAAQRSEGPRVAALNLATGEQKILVAGVGARYVDTGHLVYGAGGALRAVAFDLDRLETRGTPVSVVEQVAGGGAAGSQNATAAGQLGVGIATNGTLAYLPSSSETARRLVWLDRNGREEVLPAPPRGYVIPRISPDGSKIAVDTRGASIDILVWDIGARTMNRTTFQTSVYPVWALDSQRVLHTTFDEMNVGRLFLRPTDGSTQAERLTDGPNSRYASSMTHDGSRVIFREEGGDTGLDIGLVWLDGTRRLEPILKTAANELNGEVSPDGRWLAYESNQSGSNEVYVRPFPNVDGGLWQVSNDGGRQPAWNPKGRELFYRTADGRLMVVPVTLQPRFSAGQPVQLGDSSYYRLGPYRSYDVAPDGKRLLMIKPDLANRTPASIVIVQNWFEELRVLAPR